jgi:hypothetical protein
MVGKQPSALAVRRAEEAEIFFRSGSSYQVRAALLLHGEKHRMVIGSRCNGAYTSLDLRVCVRR